MRNASSKTAISSRSRSTANQIELSWRTSNGPDDSTMAVRAGASGVGLYRTSTFFPRIPTVPTRRSSSPRIAPSSRRRRTAPSPSAARPRRDKHVPYFGQHREAQPVMALSQHPLEQSYPEFSRHSFVPSCAPGFTAKSA